MGIVGLVHEGVPAAEVELNDGGVWVTNAKEGLVGHLNYESRMFDGGVHSDAPGFDVSQFGNDVVVTGAESVQQLSPASVALTPATSTPGIEVAHGHDRVLFTDTAAGKVWVSDLVQMGSFRPESDPLLKDLKAPKGVVGVDGDAFVVTADGTVREITGVGEDAVDTEVGTLGALTSKATFTVVGNTLVALDEGVVRTLDHATEIPGLGEHAVLQQPSLWQTRKRTPEVLVASSDGLWRVPLDGGTPYQETGSSAGQPVGGDPVQPAMLGDCAYGLWKGSGDYLRWCVDEKGNSELDPRVVRGLKEPVFRVNRRSIVINDVATGTAYLPDEAMIKVDDWDRVLQDLNKDERESKETEETAESQLQEFSETQTAPEAQDDEFGARVGRSTTLPVLLNDVDADGDVLTAMITSQPEVEGVKVTLGKDGRAVRATVPENATGSFSFRYKAFDGVKFSEEATVTVQVVQKETNRAPEKAEGRNTPVRVAERKTAEYSVLPDWVDPDGDPLYLVDASAEDQGLRVTWRPDGYISVEEVGGQGPGDRTITVLVSDGERGGQPTEGTLTVKVSPSGSNPPVANGDHFMAIVGETTTLRPLLNDTDPDGDVLRLVEVKSDSTEVEAKLDPVENTVAFTASKAGPQTLVYSISDGQHKPSRARIRVDVVDPEVVTDVPAAEDDLALMGPTGVVVVSPLANDFDPAGGVLVITSTEDVPASLLVQVVDRALLRVSAPAGIEEQQRFEYTVNNGKESASASVLVLPPPEESAKRPPVAEADTAVVRVGDIVTVDVLANDYSPSDFPIKVRPGQDSLEVRSGSELGDFFLSGDQVRFKAGENPGTAEAVYTIMDSEGLVDSEVVTISIKGRDDCPASAGDDTAGQEERECNLPPSPGPVTGRTVTGGTVRIPIPTDGIDPDGDSVELVGTGATGPQQGSVAVEGNQLVYTAAVTATGTDVFSYQVRDGFGEGADGVVRVGIAPAPRTNQAPVAVPDEVVTRPGRTLEIPVKENDTDPDGDKIVLVAGSVKPVSAKTGDDPIKVGEDSWVLQPPAPKEGQSDGQKVALVAPELDGVYRLSYEIVDQISKTREDGTEEVTDGIRTLGMVTITVDSDAEPVAPIARDDYVSAASIAGEETVDIKVLENDYDPDGRDLTLVDVESPATMAGGTVTVPVTDKRTVLLYTIEDGDGLQARAAVIVPGRAQIPPMLRPEARVEATAGVPQAIDVEDYVRVREGYKPLLYNRESVVAGRGGTITEVSLDDGVITFTAEETFHGATSVSFEVVDNKDPGGKGIEDPDGLRATLSLPIDVKAVAAQRPPVVRPATVEIEPGTERTVSLASMVNDPDPGDNEKLTFDLEDPPSRGTARIEQRNLIVSVPAGTGPGTAGTAVVSVHDGTTDPVTMNIPIVVVRSSKPLMTITPAVAEGQVGSTTTVDLTRYVTNPFHSEGKPIRIVGQPTTTGSARVEATGLTIAITPTASGEETITYTVEDATEDPSRRVNGTITLTVRGKPLPPTNVAATAVGSRTAEVSWQHTEWNGAEPVGYTVIWGDGPGESKECGQQTKCDITTLTNGNNYSFTVVARARTDSSVRSAASAPILVDVAPNRPGAPTVVKIGDGALTLSWAPVSVPDGGSAVTDYVIGIDPVDVPGGATRTVKGNEHGITWTNLTNGTNYTFTITARNKATDAGADAPKGPPSVPTAPVGAPSGQGAPKAILDPPGAATDSRRGVTLTWGPPANANGNSDFKYKYIDVQTGQEVEVGSNTSVSFDLSVGSGNRTFRISATNSSGIWSEPSPPSPPVRAVQPPSAPLNFSVRPTGEGESVYFTFDGAANSGGANASEIRYEWSVGGATIGTLTPGRDMKVPHRVFKTGERVTVKLTTVSVVDNVKYEGGFETRDVTAYGPPDPPTVTARRADNGNVDLSWSSPATSGGLTITGVEVFVDGTSIGVQHPTDSVQRGTGPNQTFTITARAINSNGVPSKDSRTDSASTRGEGNYRTGIGSSSECDSEIQGMYSPPAPENWPDATPLPECKNTTVELTDWYPNTTVVCWSDSSVRRFQLDFSIDARGSGGGVVNGGGYNTATGNHFARVESCKYP